MKCSYILALYVMSNPIYWTALLDVTGVVFAKHTLLLIITEARVSGAARSVLSDMSVTSGAW